jgi:hypothetical protein
MMKRLMFSAVGLVTLGVSVAPAANVHFVGDPTLTLNSNNTVTVGGKLAGLGNKDITITVEAVGTANVTLLNPAGHAAPGQNKFPIRSVGAVSIPKSEIKNGSVEFSVTTAPLREISGTELGAPNDQWTVRINSVDFSRVTVTVVQGGKTVLSKTFVNP